jgi:hypothetical protein
MNSQQIINITEKITKNKFNNKHKILEKNGILMIDDSCNIKKKLSDFHLIKNKCNISYTNLEKYGILMIDNS